MEKMNRMFEKLPDVLRWHRKWVLGIMIVITVILGAGAGRIVMDNSLDAFFKEHDPVKKAYDTFRTVFGGDEYIYVVYQAKDGDVFSEKSLRALKGIYDELAHYRLRLAPSEKSPLDHIVEIKSLINITYLEAAQDTLYSRSLIGDRIPINDPEREALRRKALQHPDYPHLYVSEDCAYGGILLRTDFNANVVQRGEPSATLPHRSAFDDDESFSEDVGAARYADPPNELVFEKTDMTQYPVLMQALRKILHKKAYTDALVCHLSGTPVMMDFFADAVIRDLGRILGLVLAIIIGVLFILFRSACAVVWPITVVVTTLVWVTGCIGWSGIPMSIMFQIMIFLILSAGIADSVHILSGYLFFRNKGCHHDAALRKVMKKSGLACLLTSVTTAVGLLSLTLVPIQPIAVFGVFSSIGVLAAFIITILLMPIMLDVWNPASKKDVQKEHFVQWFLQKHETVGLRRSGRVIIVFCLLGVVFFIGLMKLRIDSNDIDVFKDGLELKESYTLINTHMAGTGNMEISIDLKAENALKDPEVLYKIDALQAYIKEMEGSKVVTTLSLVNVVKESYKALYNDDDAFYKIPDDPAVLSQTVFMFENANPDDRKRLVTDDFSRARIGIHSKNVGSVEALQFMSAVQEYVDVHFRDLKGTYPDLTVTLTGNMALLAVMLDYISWSQIKSFGLTLMVISVVIFAVFANVKAGVIALVPNVFPILTTFGLMGYLDIPLDMDTLLIAPVIIGLAVDDTIHFLTHYRIEMDRGRDIKHAAVSAIREAGQAISFTSLILASGFSLFVLSFHNGLSHFGVFAAIAIITAVVADLYLLPALCAFFRVDFGKTYVRAGRSAELFVRN